MKSNESNESNEKVIQLTNENIQRAELTLLVTMEDVPEDARNKALKAFGVPDGEYARLVRKFRFVLKEFRIQRGTYKGEFDEAVNNKLDAHDMEQGHKLLDSIMKGIAKRNGVKL